MVRLRELTLNAVAEVAGPTTVELVLWDDLIDVCVGNQRTVIDRCPESTGHGLYCYALNGDVRVLMESIEQLG